MIEIKDLLLKFDNLIIREKVKIEAIQETLKQVLNIKINNKDIKIKDNTIYLNIKPIYKNEIFLNKEKIHSLLERKLGQKAPKNIR